MPRISNAFLDPEVKLAPEDGSTDGVENAPSSLGMVDAPTSGAAAGASVCTSHPPTSESKTMFNFRFHAALVGIAVLLLSSIAAAGGQYYSEEELFDLADIVVDVEVTDVRCNSAWVQNSFTFRRYDNDLMTLDVIKGEVESSFALQTTDIQESINIGPGCGSGQTPILPRGWSGRLYLVRNNDGSLVFAVADDWGVAVTDPYASVIHELPVCEPKADDDPRVDINNDDSGDNGPTGSASAARGCSVSSGSSSGSSSQGGNGFAALGLLGLVLVSRRRRLRSL